MSQERPLTYGERHMFFPIFGYTLDYENQTVELNAAPNVGGRDNSMTTGVVPRMAPSVWCADFSAASLENGAVFRGS